MTVYRARPFEVEARRIGEEDVEALIRWAGGADDPGELARWAGPRRVSICGRLTVAVANRTGSTSFAGVGDWIVRDRDGLQVLRPEAFEARFEPVE